MMGKYKLEAEAKAAMATMKECGGQLQEHPLLSRVKSVPVVEHAATALITFSVYCPNRTTHLLTRARLFGIDSTSATGSGLPKKKGADRSGAPRLADI